MKRDNSDLYFKEANKYIPGGVNSPVRSFSSVDSNPLFIKSAKGSIITDVDNNKYIDYVGSWGPMILGHADDDVISAVKSQADLGMSFGACCESEVILAKMICDIVPSIDKVRFVSSGTEATMSTVRLARAYTNRDKIIKFEGCYHGHSDSFLISAGSGALTLGKPNSPGVPQNIINDTILVKYNDITQLKNVFEKYKNTISAVIIEPVAGNMNLVKPIDGFLKKVADLCKKHNSLLILDEVMTGFRVGLTSAQGCYGITPDLTTFGKIIGGGMPVGAFGGRKDIMDMVAPQGDMYQAGTLSGNPLAMVAGIETLKKIQVKDFYKILINKTDKLVNGFNDIAQKYNVNFYADSIGGMFGFYFTDNKKIENLEDIQNSDISMFKNFFNFMIENGIYFAPSAFEVGFMSIAHSDEDIEKTLALTEKFFQLQTTN